MFGLVIFGTLSAAMPASPAPACFVAARDLPARVGLVKQDLSPVLCRAELSRARIRYDRARGMPIAAEAIAVGTYLGRIAVFSPGRVEKGAAMTLRSTAGPVTIERTVITMQPAKSGGRVFVRDSEGKVFAAPISMKAVP